MPGTKSGGDPPHQHVLGIVDRLAPKGLVAKSFLHNIGVNDPADVARKLSRAGVDIVPNGSPPRKTRPAGKPAEQGQLQGAAAPAYTDEFKSEGSILPPRFSVWRKRTGPTPTVDFGLMDVIGDISRRWHLFKVAWGLAAFLLGWTGLWGSANQGERLPPEPPAGGWIIEMKP